MLPHDAVDNIVAAIRFTSASADVATCALTWHLQVAPVAAEEFVAVEVRPATGLVFRFETLEYSAAHIPCHIHVQATVPAVVPPPANGGPPLEDNFFSSDADVSAHIRLSALSKLQKQGLDWRRC